MFIPSEALCKPKILPMKSLTMEKIEQMNREKHTAAQRALQPSLQNEGEDWVSINLNSIKRTATDEFD
jgi:hypothetical protein